MSSINNPYTAFQIRMNKLLIKGDLGDKSLIMAYDHGIEHRADFTIPESSNPDYVLSIAEKADIPLVMHKGTYIRYAHNHPEVPMVIKLNGKTEMFYNNRPAQSGLDCSVKEAVSICPNLAAVGFSLYVGSSEEPLLLEQLSNIVREARGFQIPVIVWSYIRQHDPRKKELEGKMENVRYAARVAFENGADMVKLYYPENVEGLKAVKNYVPGIYCLIAGGAKKDTVQVAYESAHDIAKYFQDPTSFKIPNLSIKLLGTKLFSKVRPWRRLCRFIIKKKPLYLKYNK